MIITHGWPGSVLEMLKIIGPLADPTAHGGRAEDAFHLVLPSMSGYGFSGKPQRTGWGPDHIGRAWDVLMKRLGYQSVRVPRRRLGRGDLRPHGGPAPAGPARHPRQQPATVPPDIAKVLAAGGPAPAGLSPEEKAAFDSLYKKGSGYSAIMVTRPQTVGYGLTDSPAGLAAWMYDKFAAWTYSGGIPERSLTRDEMLDDITLYWVTNSAISPAQLYWENNANNFNAVDISLPAAVTVFPGELYRAPRSWTERSYHQLIYFNEVNKGGHFAAWEEPALFSTEIRAAFRSLR